MPKFKIYKNGIDKTFIGLIWKIENTRYDYVGIPKKSCIGWLWKIEYTKYWKALLPYRFEANASDQINRKQ